MRTLLSIKFISNLFDFDYDDEDDNSCMKKDIFNGKIKEELVGRMKFTIAYVIVLFPLLGLLFVLFLVFKKDLPSGANILFVVAASICFLYGIGYPCITIPVVRSYPKHKRIAHLLVRSYFFNDDNDREQS